MAALLHEAGYSLQANRKTREGLVASRPQRPVRAHQRQVGRFLRRGQPAISVDTKKKELVGDFKNGGREWRPQGEPEEVRVHDFLDKTLGKAIPYGVYDMARNQGWVSVGIDHDTAEFAADSIRRWWRRDGPRRFPKSQRVAHHRRRRRQQRPSHAACGRWRCKNLADDIGLTLTVCHFPPGTSKWNKIEHRLFCFITQNWRGQPLVSLQAIVSLIASTTTSTGLIVKAAMDTNHYETEIKVSDEELARLRLKRHEFHGDWNYTDLASASQEIVKVISAKPLPVAGADRVQAMRLWVLRKTHEPGVGQGANPVCLLSLHGLRCVSFRRAAVMLEQAGPHRPAGRGRLGGCSQPALRARADQGRVRPPSAGAEARRRPGGRPSGEADQAGQEEHLSTD